MTKGEKAQAIVAKVHELEEKKITFIRFADVLSFLAICEAVGIVAFGGAFASDMTGQYFYI